MANKSVVTPEAYSGVESWDEWIDHFECVADVNTVSQYSELSVSLSLLSYIAVLDRNL